MRVPLAGTDPMDLRIWPQAQTLAAIAPFVRRAPRLWYASAAPVFQLRQFVDGVLLDDVAPGVCGPGTGQPRVHCGRLWEYPPIRWSCAGCSTLPTGCGAWPDPPTRGGSGGQLTR